MGERSQRRCRKEGRHRVRCNAWPTAFASRRIVQRLQPADGGDMASSTRRSPVAATCRWSTSPANLAAGFSGLLPQRASDIDRLLLDKLAFQEDLELSGNGGVGGNDPTAKVRIGAATPLRPLPLCARHARPLQLAGAVTPPCRLVCQSKECASASPSALGGAQHRLPSCDRGAPHYARAWNEVLARPLVEIAAFLVDPREHARELRQSTPFAGVLPPRERWRLWREVREQVTGHR